MPNTTNDTLQSLKGFRDFLPAEAQNRNYVKNRLIATFEEYGFNPLETPTLEYASLLLGKYGTEADKLIYSFTDRGGRQVGLRYDQTVPTARVLAQYGNQLPKYFRRYQIQNVFRADKPQRGRYREFTQCDIDIFGTTSATADAEILACTNSAFKALGILNPIIQINDRQTLMATLQPWATDQVNIFSIIQSIDKLDKLPSAAVIDELVVKGLARSAAGAVLKAISEATRSANLAEIITQAIYLGVPEKNLVFTPTLARGLDYYTGMIFEVRVEGYTAGSCGGGGRYDNLIETLSGVKMPAVGMAFGFDRLVEIVNQLGLIQGNDSTSAQVLVGIIDENTLKPTLTAAQTLRNSQIRVEVCPELLKLGKLLKLADNLKVKVVAFIGSQEAQNNQVTIKDLKSGQQLTVAQSDILPTIKQFLSKS